MRYLRCIRSYWIRPLLLSVVLLVSLAGCDWESILGIDPKCKGPNCGGNAATIGASLPL